MKRILTASRPDPAVFALIFLGQLWMLTLVACLVAELAAYEYLTLANSRRRPHPGVVDGRGDGASLPVTYCRASTTEASFPLLSVAGAGSACLGGFRAPLERVLPDAAWASSAWSMSPIPLTLIP